MRETFKRTIENLPPTGIAMHGTTLARAMRIKEEGFDPRMAQYEYDGNGYTFYVIQPPNVNRHLDTLRHLRGKVNYSPIHLAILHANEKAKSEQGEPAIVIFTPLTPLHNTLTGYGIPFQAFDSRHIPPENIHDVVKISSDKNGMDSQILRSCINTLKNRGVISLAKHQLPDQVQTSSPSSRGI